MWNYLYLIVCLLFSILLLSFFKSKQRIDSKENSLFVILLYLCIISISTELILQFVTINYGVNNLFTIFLSKLYLVTIIIWFGFFSKYIFYLFKPTPENTSGNYEEEYKLFMKKYGVINTIHNVLLIIFTIVSFLLPIKYYISGDSMYSYGMAVDFLRIVLFFFVFSWIIDSVKNYRKILEIKYISILVVIILLVANILLQKVNPTLLIVSFTLTFLSYIMYFTIENPDIKLMQQLEIAKEQADKANAAKTDFLSSMSHEIRTPLNAINGFSNLIEEAKTLEEAKANAKDIVNASDTLLEIVNGILDISKIEAGKLEIVESPYNAKETFEELAKLITPRMEEKGLEFTSFVAPDLPNTLYGDHANIKKIVTNFLSNACKYTEKGFVKYEVNCINSNDKCKLIISVEDSGRGIKKENIDKLFTKFDRLDVERNTTVEGTGLGLAITKQLVELMGGKIIVHTVYGEGSKFTVMLDQKIEKAEILEELKPKTTIDLNNTKIMLVDDNELNLKVGTKMLERYGCSNVTQAHSGFECLDLVKAGTYDLILLDDMMPKMSGGDTLIELRKIPGFATPVVALTANAISGMREKYLEQGFDEYLAKPIEKDEFIKVLNKMITTKSDVVTETVNDTNNSEAEVLGEDNSSERVSAEAIEPPEMDNETYLRNHGVDMDKALELLGDMEMYNMTFSDFEKELESKWSKIEQEKLSGDMENYAIDVHSLKSDCKYLGFYNLADVAYEHELKSKEKDKDFVDSNFDRLETEYEKVLHIVKEYKEKLR